MCLQLVIFRTYKLYGIKKAPFCSSSKIGCIQVCLEGQISRNSTLKCLQKGQLPPGDQIPSKFCEVFRDTEFSSLSGARVVRIAVHPSALRVSV